jgi:hypothetical protein
MQVNVKVQFTKDTAFANQQFLFLVRFSTKFPSPVRFSEIRIEFNDTNYSTKIESESRIHIQCELRGRDGRDGREMEERWKRDGREMEER